MATTIGEGVLRPGEPLSPAHKKLFGEIALRAELAEQGDWEAVAKRKARTILICGAGNMRCTDNVGRAKALEDYGLAFGFDAASGISGGVFTAASLLSKKVGLCEQVYLNLLTGKQLIDLKRRNRKVNIPHLGDILTNDEPMDWQDIVNSGTDFYVGATRIDNGSCQEEYIQINQENGPYTVGYLMASASIPRLSPVIRIKDKVYADGVMSCRNPLRFFLDEFQEGHDLYALYLQNQPLREEVAGVKGRIKNIGEFALAFYLAGRRPHLRKGFRDRHLDSDEQRTGTYYEDFCLGVSCPRSAISRLETREEVLRKTIESAREEMGTFIESALQPDAVAAAS